MKTLIVPAIIAKTQNEVDNMLSTVRGKAERIMIDIMDGKFVPNTSLMFDFKLPTSFDYEAHLMINDPLDWVKVNGYKVNLAIFHIESLNNIEEAIEVAKKIGIKTSLGLRPETKLDLIVPYLEKIDGVLIMTADPGSYCVEFLPESLEKIKALRKINDTIPIEVDGCMSPKNAKIAREAGANIFASGSHIFKSDNVEKAIRELKKAIE